MSKFAFGNINIKEKKTKENKFTKFLISDPNSLLIDKSNTRASYSFVPVVLSDMVHDAHNKEMLVAIDKFLTSSGLPRYILVSCLNCRFANKDEVVLEESESYPNDDTLFKKLDGGKIKFFKNHKSNFEDYLKEGTPVIATGASLYSLLMEDDIFTSYTYQAIFGKTWFTFSKDLTDKNQISVFPIDSFEQLFQLGTDKPIDSFKTKRAKFQCKKVATIGGNPLPKFPKLNKIFVSSAEEFDSLFYDVVKDKKDEILAWDLETSGLSFMKDRIGCITLSFDGLTGWYIPWRYVDKEKLNEVMGNNRLLSANGKFDCKFLWKNGVPNARIDEDVITLGHTLDETRSNSLKTLAFFYSEFGGYERELDEYKEKMGRNINYLDIPENILREYAVMDAIVTKRIFDNMLKHLRELDVNYPNKAYPSDTLEVYYRQRRIPAENLYAGIEYRGVYVNKDKLDALRVKMTDYLNNLKKEICNELGVPEDFNLSSATELGKLLKKLKWENLGVSKTGEYLTGDYQLERWAKNHPVAAKLQNMRSVATLINGFVGDNGESSIMDKFLGEVNDEGTKGWSQYLVYHEEDGTYRMHPDYFPMGTDSGRTRCAKPNMQNVPTHGMFTSDIKKCLCTPNDEEYYMVTIDYSSLQMRLAAMDYVKDDLLKQTFRHPDADVHSATAWATFMKGKPQNITEITLRNSEETLNYLGGEKIMTTNRGEIIASELEETDVIQLKGREYKDFTIDKKNVTREITVDEFRVQKNVQPYKNLRQLGKSLNFMLIFGGSAKTFAEYALETSWSEEQLDNFLEENNCKELLAETMQSFPRESKIKQKMIAVAAFMRKGYFEGFPGLLARLDVESEFAEKHGFLRSVFGSKRNVIELLLKGSYDNSRYSKVASNLTRITYNYKAQNYEAAITKRAMYEMEMWLEKRGMKTRVWNEIHDSQDYYVYKEELHDVIAHLKHICERKVPELIETWSPLPVDCEISDLTKGDYYKGGRDPKEFGLDWNNIIYEDPDPYGVELIPSEEEEYFKKRAEYWKSKNMEDPYLKKKIKVRQIRK